MSIFKACDVRGRYGPDLTPGVAEKLGRAVGTILTGKTVVVGGDVRLSTPALKAALINGLVAAGSHALDVGILPTPAFYFAKGHLGAAGGVMVTGSHNPPDDNGFKISLGRWPITEAELAELAWRMDAGDLAQGDGSHRQVDVLGDYAAFIRDMFPGRGRLKVIVDAGNGCYSHIAPQVLREVGYEVVELFCEPDGRFPNRPPNPAIAANLRSLQETVLRTGADMGAAYDGDGDRVVFVDERGRVVESDRSIVIFARHLLRQGPGEVIFDIKCSSIVPEGIRQAGGAPVMEKSGHAFIKTSLSRRNALMGGEISGHFFFRELGGDDGLYATLLMAKIVAESGQGLAALADSLPRYPITPDIRLPCPPEEAQAIVAELAEAFGEEPDCEVSTLDGVRIDWPDGWALIRPSVTEPLLTLRFEARSEKRLAQIQAVVIAHSPRLGRVAYRSNHLFSIANSEIPDG